MGEVIRQQQLKHNGSDVVVEERPKQQRPIVLPQVLVEKDEGHLAAALIEAYEGRIPGLLSPLRGKRR